MMFKFFVGCMAHSGKLRAVQDDALLLFGSVFGQKYGIYPIELISFSGIHSNHEKTQSHYS